MYINMMNRKLEVTIDYINALNTDWFHFHSDKKIHQKYIA